MFALPKAGCNVPVNNSLIRRLKNKFNVYAMRRCVSIIKDAPPTYIYTHTHTHTLKHVSAQLLTIDRAAI